MSRKVEFGDFQTPLTLARAVCHRLASDGIAPDAIVEPTCGDGAFLRAAAEVWPRSRRIGYEIDPEHRRNAEAADPDASVRAGDAFALDWHAIFADAAPAGASLLVLGNPPWVTSAGVGALDGSNRPERTNPGGLRGLDAMTGASNFDVSEWLTLRWLDALHGMPRHHIALLLKSSTIRRAVSHHWRHGPPLAGVRHHAIDARRHFDASVAAGLVVARLGEPAVFDCPTHPALDGPAVGGFGWRDGALVADAGAWDRARAFLGGGPRWRSGIKHDCARVLELRPRDGGWINGFGEPVDVEADVLYPLMKSADVAGDRAPRRALLLPHVAANGDPAALGARAPRALAYLERHGEAFDRRRSAIYRKRPRFSVFGLGPYSFAAHKVAVSGLYDPVRFTAVGPVDGRPVLFDDTVYALPCADAAEADAIVDAMRHAIGRDAIAALSFPEAKRPITAAQLGRIDLDRLRAAIGA